MDFDSWSIVPVSTKPASIIFPATQPYKEIRPSRSPLKMKDCDAWEAVIVDKRLQSSIDVSPRTAACRDRRPGFALRPGRRRSRGADNGAAYDRLPHARRRAQAADLRRTRRPRNS